MAIYIIVVGLVSDLDRWCPRLPQLRGPARERISERLGRAGPGDQGQKALDMAIAVGPQPPGEQRERIASVAAEIPGAPQPGGGQKEEREEQRADGRGAHAPKAGGGGGSRQGRRQRRDQAGLVRSREQEEPTSALLPAARDRALRI